MPRLINCLNRYLNRRLIGLAGCAVLIGGVFITGTVTAAIQVGVITRVEGDVQLLTHPTRNVSRPQGPGPHVVYEDVAYSVKAAEQGDEIKHSFVVKTGKNGKARVVYKNGDQVTVAEDTAFTFKWNPKTEKETVMDVFSGKVRYLIQKDGDRSGMEVRTKSAVMGVRGTDFFVQAWSAKGGTEVSVLRGTVAVKPVGQAPSEKAVEVPAGYNLAVASQAAPAPETPSASDKQAAENPTTPNSPAPAPKVELTKITQQELVIIQHTTKVEKPKEQPKQGAAEIEQLEKKAVEATLVDIKTHEPALYAEITKKSGPEAKSIEDIGDVDVIQQQTIKKLFDEAPSAAGQNKPSLKDLESGGDVYEKYKWGN